MNSNLALQLITSISWSRRPWKFNRRKILHDDGHEIEDWLPQPNLTLQVSSKNSDSHQNCVYKTMQKQNDLENLFEKSTYLGFVLLNKLLSKVSEFSKVFSY